MFVDVVFTIYSIKKILVLTFVAFRKIEHVLLVLKNKRIKI